MEDKIKSCYISKLLKIQHKPILIEYILSFLKINPTILLRLIREDKFLKAILNNLFSNLKKNSSLSPELCYNLNLLLIQKHFIQEIKHKINYESLFLDKKNENIIDPSFISFYTNELIRKIESKKNNYIEKHFPTVKDLNDIIYTRYENDFYFEQIVFLPAKEANGLLYVDGLYLQNKLNKAKDKKFKHIETLYCIIDDNEYYNKIESINHDIIIDEIYFIFKFNNKNLDIYKAINKYLEKININNIKEITFGKGFFETKKISMYSYFTQYFNDYREGYTLDCPIMNFLEKEVFISKKKIKIPNLQKINLKNEKFIGDELKLYLGISLLADKEIMLDDVNIINSKEFKNKKIEKIEKSCVLIKIHQFSFLKMKNFIDFVNECINKSQNVILYLSHDINKNHKIENLKIENETFYLNLKNQNFLFYSEFPLKYNFNINKDYSKCINVVKNKKNIILYEYYYNYYKFNFDKTDRTWGDLKYVDNIFDFLFLFAKYKEMNIYNYNYYSGFFNYPKFDTLNKSEIDAQKENAIINCLQNKYNINI